MVAIFAVVIRLPGALLPLGMAFSSFEFPYGSPCPMDTRNSFLCGSSSSPYSFVADAPACTSGGLPEQSPISLLMLAVQQLQSQVTVMADAIMADMQHRAADRAAAALERVAEIQDAYLLRAAERAARAEEQRNALERIDALARVQQQMLENVATAKAASTWICPVCRDPLIAMRSFKGHIKRLYEYSIVTHPADGKTRKCSLKSHVEHHRALVSRSPGDHFLVQARQFATDLWHQVQCLTSSDDCPDFVGCSDIAVVDGVGVAPY
jgi:hypothetical protein